MCETSSRSTRIRSLPSKRNRSNSSPLPTNAKSTPEEQPGELYKSSTPRKSTPKIDHLPSSSTTRTTSRRKYDRYVRSPFQLLTPSSKVKNSSFRSSWNSTRWEEIFTGIYVRYPRTKMSTNIMIQVEEIAKRERKYLQEGHWGVESRREKGKIDKR